MKKRLLLAALCSFGVGIAPANPYLTSDPQCFDPTGADASCPNGYEVSEDDGATWQELGADISEDTIVVWEDLGLYSQGSHTMLVRAYNAWEVSDTVPLSFYCWASGCSFWLPSGSNGWHRP